MNISRHQTTGQNNYINLANESFDSVVKLESLEAMLTNQYEFTWEINKSRPNSGNAFYHAHYSLWFCRLISKIAKLKYTETVMLLVLYGYETWSVKLREDYRLMMVFENCAEEHVRPKRCDVRSDWRKFRDERDCNFTFR
jgi:hypothetical protein